MIDYDHASHRLSATLPAGGTASLIAPGGVQIQGDVAITGQVTVTQDVVAGGISLIHHRHPGIQPGGGQTGEPV
ncbi:hypothetical protein D9M69_697700 [compost metagenome]